MLVVRTLEHVSSLPELNRSLDTSMKVSLQSKMSAMSDSGPNLSRHSPRPHSFAHCSVHPVDELGLRRAALRPPTRPIKTKICPRSPSSTRSHSETSQQSSEARWNTWLRSMSHSCSVKSLSIKGAPRTKSNLLQPNEPIVHSIRARDLKRLVLSQAPADPTSARLLETWMSSLSMLSTCTLTTITQNPNLNVSAAKVPLVSQIITEPIFRNQS